MANYPVKLLKDKDGTAFVPVVNSDSIITPEGDTLNDLLEEKQDLLTSGTNIKTINNESLLGSGNISIQGGSGASVWGSITGTLSNQTDLDNELSNKVDKSAYYGDDISGMYVNDSFYGIGLLVSDVDGKKYGSVNINTNGVKINGLITPTNNKDAANKEYVDSVIPTKTSDLTNDSGFITSSANKYSLTELKALTDPTDDLFLSLKADIINHNPMVITYNYTDESVVLSSSVETAEVGGVEQEVYIISFKKNKGGVPHFVYTLGFIGAGESLKVQEIIQMESEIPAFNCPLAHSVSLDAYEPGDTIVCKTDYGFQMRLTESDEYQTVKGIRYDDIFIRWNGQTGSTYLVGYLAHPTNYGTAIVHSAVYYKSDSGFSVSKTNPSGYAINPVANGIREITAGTNITINTDEYNDSVYISANENEAYGTCSSSGDASVKVVNVVRGSYLIESTVGNILRVRFDNALTCNNPTLRVGYGTSFDIYDRDTNNKLQSGAWGAGDIVTFYWDGSVVRAIAGLRATTTNYGEAKLSSSVSSTSTTEAATSSAVRQAYNLANSKQDALVSGTNIKTINNESLLGSGNVSLAGAETLPVGSEIDYDGTTVPTGWEQVAYPNIITAYLANATYSITTSSVYEKIPLDGSESVGSKLTLNSSGEIVVGAGVTKVKASAKICMVGNTIVAGTKNFVIMKNNNIVERIWNKIDTYNSTLIIPMSMFSVAEGDKITMAYYGVQNETANYGAPFTTLTVEVVE